MSHIATNWASQQRGLSPSAYRILSVLADCHNPELGCFPSQEYLADRCEIGRATVNRQLKNLEEMGYLKRQKRRNNTTKKREATRYILAFENDFTTAKTMSHFDQKPCLNLSQTHVSLRDSNPVIEPITTIIGRERIKFNCSEKMEPIVRSMFEALGSPVDMETNVQEPQMWLEEGCDLEMDIIPTLQNLADPSKTIRTWSYCTAAIFNAKARRLKPATKPKSKARQLVSGMASRFSQMSEHARGKGQ